MFFALHFCFSVLPQTYSHCTASTLTLNSFVTLWKFLWLYFPFFYQPFLFSTFNCPIQIKNTKLWKFRTSVFRQQELPSITLNRWLCCSVFCFDISYQRAFSHLPEFVPLLSFYFLIVLLNYPYLLCILCYISSIFQLVQENYECSVVTFVIVFVRRGCRMTGPVRSPRQYIRGLSCHFCEIKSWKLPGHDRTCPVIRHPRFVSWIKTNESRLHTNPKGRTICHQSVYLVGSNTTVW